MNRALLAASAVIAMTATGMSATAATVKTAVLSGVQGPVMVSHAGVYAPAKSAQVVGMGDRIVALKGAAAKVAFSDGCVVGLKSAEMLTISNVSACKAGQVVRVATQSQAGGTGGAAGAEAGATTTFLGVEVPATIAGVSAGIAIPVIAVAVAVGVGVGVSESQSSNSP